MARTGIRRLVVQIRAIEQDDLILVGVRPQSNCSVTLSAAAGALPSLGPLNINGSSVNASNSSNVSEDGEARNLLSMTLHPAADASDLFVTVAHRAS